MLHMESMVDLLCYLWNLFIELWFKMQFVNSIMDGIIFCGNAMELMYERSEKSQTENKLRLFYAK